MQQLAQFLIATGRRLRVLGNVICHFFRKGNSVSSSQSRSRSWSRSRRRSRPTGTGENNAPTGAASAAPVSPFERSETIGVSSANIAELFWADSREYVFASTVQGISEPLPLPVRTHAVSPGHACRSVPIAGSGKPLRTSSARSPWHNTAQCSWLDPIVRHRAGRVAKSCRHDRHTSPPRPTTYVNLTSATDSFS